MNNMTIGRYMPFNTIIHRLDPRTKLLGMIVLMVTIFTNQSGLVYAGVGLVIAILLKLSKLSIWKTLKGLKFLWIMFLFLTVMNIFFIKTGPLLFTVPFVHVPVFADAIIRTGFILVRIAMMISIATILTSSTKPLDLTLGLEWWLAPLKIIKIPVAIFAMMISIALRFIPTLMDEAQRIMKAQASRGLDMENGKLKDKVRGVVALIIPLLVSSFNMASDLADAMDVRGYDPQAKRTRYRVLKAKFSDFAAIAFCGAVLAVAIIATKNSWDFNTIAEVFK